MKAIVRTQYGPPTVVRFAEVATPTPADNQVMIKVRAASVNPLDVFSMKGMPWNRLPGLRKPKHEVLGCDIAGQVEAAGINVKLFQAAKRWRLAGGGPERSPCPVGSLVAAGLTRCAMATSIRPGVLHAEARFLSEAIHLKVAADTKCLRK
jgi:NADPH:quinone reductase-like Zn-dependent oxidoreductase